MPIIELQRRLREIGRIRLGEKVAAQNGKTRPAKLTTFRFTSRDRRVVDAAAATWGGRVTPWDDAPDGQQWQVTIESPEVTVVVPPGMAFSQWYELWSAGGCQRRCDGAYDTVGERPCVCDPERRDCKMTTRLSVIVPDLPGFGVWRVESHGYYAAVELSGLVELCQQHAARGAMLPARLRLEQRSVKRTVQGQVQTFRFAVPVLDIDVHPLALGSVGTAGELAHHQAAGELGPARDLTPVPALPAGSVRSLADQVSAVDDPAPRAHRSNAAEPLRSTGLEPRRATDRAPTPPTDGGGSPEPPTLTVQEVGRMAQATFKADHDAAPSGKKKAVIGRLRHAVANVVTKGRVNTVSDCTPEERARVVSMLGDISQGRITYRHDALNDKAGVTFTLLRPGHPEGDKAVDVVWADIEPSVDDGGGS